MTAHYTSVAKTLHWLMVILLFGLLALGFIMTDLRRCHHKSCSFISFDLGPAMEHLSGFSTWLILARPPL